MTIHFISGLPRSGSTLLASLLCQNPAFTSSFESPVGQMLTDLTRGLNTSEVQFLTPESVRLRVLRGVFSSYYGETIKKTIFDQNRRWCAQASLLGKLFPDSKIICMLRPPVAIIDSFERLYHRNPAHLSVILGGAVNTNVYMRVATYIAADAVFGFAWSSFTDAFYSNRERLVLVNYDDLAHAPEKTMTDLHATLKLPAFKYDFEHIKPLPGAVEFDRFIKAPGLHDLKPKVSYEERRSILPLDIIASLPKPFWMQKAA